MSTAPSLIESSSAALAGRVGKRRPLNLQDHFRSRVESRRVIDDLRPGGAVGLIGKAGTITGAALDHYAVAQFDQLRYDVGRERDSSFPRHCFPRHSYLHQLLI